MFIVSQDGSKCHELKTIEKKYELNQQGQRELKKIEDKSETYYSHELIIYRYKDYRNYEERNNDIERLYNEYEECLVLVNGTLFGSYKKDIGDKIFDEIIRALQTGSTMYDLRLWEEVKE